MKTLYDNNEAHGSVNRVLKLRELDGLTIEYISFTFDNGARWALYVLRV